MSYLWDSDVGLFPTLVLHDDARKGYPQLEDRKVLMHRYPVGMRLFMHANVRQLVSTLRAEFQDATYGLPELLPTLREKYFVYFSTANEPPVSADEADRIVAAIGAAALDAQRKARVLYNARRAAFLHAQTGAYVPQTNGIAEDTRDRTLFASPKNMAPQFRQNGPPRGLFSTR
jgi:hypothetical protein